MIRRLAVSLCLALACAVTAGWTASGVDPDLLAGMKARSIGPAGMSGRVAAVDAVVSDPEIIYVGAATGGVWKSENGGLTWKPVFDDQTVAAIGAVAINQSSPDIVWVGTGEGNPRNSASVGNGVYRTLDGGRTWSHLGLEKTERIHRIVLHPADPDTAWVAALGRMWGENKERGVFKTTDGGRTWRQVLYVDERTGAADLVADPTNPKKLLAAMWDYRRWPWSFRSGGPGSGLHVSLDGGETWTRRTPEDGLPEGELGRMGIAISRSHPSIVYALIESEKEHAVYVSRDGGKKWSKAGSDDDAGNRPFYYADLRVDPEWPDRVYSLWSLVSVSDDGGKSFRVLVPFRAVHPDHHAMWINPRDPRQIILGNDGGVAFSSDRGETWRFASNLPLAQYYHIRHDMDVPYNVYGGMQDNGSWRGPSSVWENGGIRNHHWEEVGFGDGFDTAPLPVDSLSGYSMSQEGYLYRWDLRTGERKNIRPAGPPGTELRFNWNAALAQDPFDPDTIYYGSQFVHRSTDRGETWEILSGDLTTNRAEWQKQADSGGLTPDVTGAENFTSIVALAPSPVQRGVLWAGTDDGRLHVTRDGGRTWTSVEKGLKGAPAHTWIPHIAASPHDAGTAFVVLDDHRRSNWTPYVYRTTDFGKTFKSLATGDIEGYCLTIDQDPVQPGLLFLGTEFGLYVSLDAGSSWFKWTHGVPTVSVMDLAIHPRDHDLILGTHGRAAFILDDIRPLRSLSAEVMAQPLHLFDIPDAQQYRVKQTGASRFPGHGEFRGENRSYGALLTFALNVEGLPHPDEEKERIRKEAERAAERKEAGKKTTAESKEEEKGAGEGRRGRRGRARGPQVEIEVRDASGEVIRTFKAPAAQGVNRAAWNLRRDGFKRPPSDDDDDDDDFMPSGPEVLPGTYTITVKYKDHEASAPVRVLADPRFQIGAAARQAKYDAVMRAGRLQETVAEAVKRILRTREEIGLVQARARKEDGADEARDRGADGAAGEEAGDEQGGSGKDPLAELRKEGDRLKEKLEAMEKRLRVPPGTRGIVADRDVAYSRVRFAQFSLGSSWDAPTPAQLRSLDEAQELLSEVLAEFNRLYAEEVAAFRARVQDAGISLFSPEEPLSLD